MNAISKKGMMFEVIHAEHNQLVQFFGVPLYQHFSTVSISPHNFISGVPSKQA